MDNTSHVQFTQYDDDRLLGALSGPGGVNPLVLTNGWYLRLMILLERVPHQGGHRLRVRESSFQYQKDVLGKEWVFRYDYVRAPSNPTTPPAHVQIRGSLDHHGALSRKGALKDIHFPTMRVSLEAVIRLLVYEFDVSCRCDEILWKPVLEEAEKLFHEINRKPSHSGETSTGKSKPAKKTKKK